MGRNKPRHKTKKNGLSNKDYCHHCLSYNCDPMYFMNTVATNKRLGRRRLNLCEGCGNKDCKCKNKKEY